MKNLIRVISRLNGFFALERCSTAYGMFKFRKFGAFGFIVIFLVCLSFSPSPAMGQFFFMENEQVGKPAEDFTLGTLSGGQKNFTEFRNGQKAIIVFWATWCPHCRAQTKELNKTKDGFVQKGIKLVLVDEGEKTSVVRQYVTKNKLDFIIFLDKDSSLADPYGIVGLPTFVFVDKEGIIRDVTHGIPKNYEAILSSKKVGVKDQKPNAVSAKELPENSIVSQFFEKLKSFFIKK